MSICTIAPCAGIPALYTQLMNNANKTYEMLRVGTTDTYQVRCIETGTETIGLSKGAAGRILRALRG